MNRLLRKIRFSVSVSASALIALVVGFALTAIIFTAERQVESGRQKVQFQQSAKLRILAIKTGLQDSAEQLVVLNQLFSSFGVISRQQFHTFTAPILQRYPQIQGKRLASTVIDFFCLTRSLIQSAFYTKRSTTFHGNKSATLLIG
ncbi:hypothetical protein ACO0K7_04190, partial [Undibacterium sp. Ji67W]